MNNKLLFKLLQFATVSVFLGRAWQHLIWDAPYRVLFWDENWMSGLVSNLLGMEWQTYVTHPTTDIYIQNLTTASGWFYVLCAIVALLIHKIPRWTHAILILGAIHLMFLSFLYTKDKFYHFAQFFEYTLQWSSPIFLFFLYKTKEFTPKVIFYLKIATALTFTCHGLYAIGYYPRPGHFVEMTLSILPISEATAIWFLVAAGVLDFVVSIALFLPNSWVLLAAAYATAWGLATTAARVWAHFYLEFWSDSLMMWTHESVLRFPHFLIPLMLFLYYRNRI